MFFDGSATRTPRQPAMVIALQHRATKFSSQGGTYLGPSTRSMSKSKCSWAGLAAQASASLSSFSNSASCLDSKRCMASPWPSQNATVDISIWKGPRMYDLLLWTARDNQEMKDLFFYHSTAASDAAWVSAHSGGSLPGGLCCPVKATQPVVNTNNPHANLPPCRVPSRTWLKQFHSIPMLHPRILQATPNLVLNHQADDASNCLCQTEDGTPRQSIRNVHA